LIGLREQGIPKLDPRLGNAVGLEYAVHALAARVIGLQVLRLGKGGGMEFKYSTISAFNSPKAQTMGKL